MVAVESGVEVAVGSALAVGSTPGNGLTMVVVNRHESLVALCETKSRLNGGSLNV